MTTATIEPTEATATPPVNPQTRMRQLIDAAARGEPVDPVERRDLCFEIGWSRKVFDRHVRDQKYRFDLPKERERRQQQFARKSELEADREAVRKKCDAKIAELMREVERQKQVAYEELVEHDRQHGAEIEQLRHLQSGEREWESDYQKTMVRTADRRIGMRIAEANTRLLELQAEAENCQERLREKRQYDEVIEQTGIGPRLVSRTFIDRNWWQARFDAARSVIDDPESHPTERRKYEPVYHAAAARLDTIDTANKRLQEIYTEQAAINQKISELQKLFYEPTLLHIDFNEADA